MSFGGSQGTIKYVLQVDDAQATQKLNTFNSSLKQVGVTSLTTGKNVSTMGTQFNAGLNQIKSAGAPLAQLDKQTVSLGTRIKDTASKFGGFAIGLSATVSSALQLGASFRDFNDAQVIVERTARKLSVSQEALGKAQDKLNKLTASGVTSGKDYEQAQLDIKQAQSQVEIQTASLKNAQENLFDSQAQFVASVVPTVLGAFGTMTIAMKDLGLNMTKLKGVFGSGGAAAKLFSSDLGLIGGAAGLAVTAAILIIDQLEKMKSRLKEAGVQVTQTSKSFIQAFIDMDLAKFNSEMKQSMLEFDNLNKIMRTTPWHLATTDVQTLKKEIEAAGGVFDKTGKLMEVQTDHVFELAKGFKDSSTTWIKWMTNYRLAGESQAQIMERLKKAGFDLATAQKIATAAEENVTNIRKAGIPTTQEAAKATQGLTKSEQEKLKVDEKIAAANNQMFQDVKDQVAANKALVQTTKPYTEEMLKLVDAVNQGAQRIGEFNKVGTEFNRVLKTAESSGVTAMITKTTNEVAKLAPKVSGTTIEIQRLDNEMQTLSDKRAPEMRDKMIEAAKASQEAWKSFADSFNMAGGIKDALNIKFDSAKFTKQLVNALPSKLEKAVKLDLKFEEKGTQFRKSVQDFLQGVLEAQPKGGFKWDPDLKIDDKKASDIAKDLVKSIDKNFGKGGKNAPADLKGLRDTLKAALDRGASESEIEKILADNVKNAPPIPVYFVDAPGTAADLSKSVEKKMPAIKVPMVPWWQQIDANKKDGKTDVSYSTGGVEQDLCYNDMGARVRCSGSKTPIKVPPKKVPKGDYGTGAYGTIDPKTGLPIVQPKTGGYLSIAQYQQAGVKVNPMDVAARQAVQLTKDYNLLARAIVQISTNNNTLARTTSQVATNNNTLARTIVTVTKDYNTEARAIVTTTKDNNQLARTITTIVKDNNQLAKTIVTVTKDYSQEARAIVTVTKDNNQLAKTTVTLTKDNNSLARTISQITKNLNQMARAMAQSTSNAKKLASAIRSIPSGGGGGGGDWTSHIFQHGFHGWVNKAMPFIAGEAGPEYVSVTPKSQMGSSGGSTGGGGGGMGNLTIELINVLADREIVRTFRRKLGEDIYRFGPT